MMGFYYFHVPKCISGHFLIQQKGQNLGLAATVRQEYQIWYWTLLFSCCFDWGRCRSGRLPLGLSQCVGGVIPLIYFLRPNTSLCD